MIAMDDDQLLRYSRHILLPEFGIQGQQKILKSHALIIGAGGLGAPVCMYLAASGIGKITISDGDHVDLTNLQRQIVHFTQDIGKQKVLSAKETLKMLNPSTVVKAIPNRVNQTSIMELVEETDIVIDCSDNFQTRHNINKACVKLGKPLVSGAAIKFEGQISVFDNRVHDSPCYECLYPENGDFEETRCAVMGVFSPIVGIIGAIQALETLKTLAKVGSTMLGKLLLFNGLTSDWQTLNLHKDPKCKICSADAKN